MEAFSSSKVTVEYHDPSGVFPLISHQLQNRLPLRNLNWQSHARPLRQIKHLHVDFVPSPETQSILRVTASQKTAQATDSIDILRSGFEAPKVAAKERRHQIPGLKTTPFLKIYVLRCDDKDWYKQEERRKLKDWVRDIKTEDGRHEHHDAFEWLIVHVVIPDTIAASEQRWKESAKDPDELTERSKGKKTVLDRLRADFNDGKPAKDHVAQIRLSKSQVAVDLLPVPALARTIEESADEREKSWSDLVTKIRTFILSSFDARVRQYEEDIFEQDSRRSFPGWNFCTFFIHKEGLANAFESVGLVEDALAIYDELSLGLEIVLTDIASGEAAQTATSFSSTGSDIVDRITGDKRTSKDVLPLKRLFDKDYREEIVRSSISVFDFFCYLFERQTSLILRLAGRATTSVSGIKEGGDDLVMLAEVCWRGLSFIHNSARTLKQDLLAKASHENVQSLVLSWTYAAADFVLVQTESQHLDLTDAGVKAPGKLANGHKSIPSRTEFGFSMGADAYPQRNSSLPFRKPPPGSEVKSITSTSSAGKTSLDGFVSPPSSSGNDGMRPAEVPGLAELAAYRAELVALKRKMLDALAAGKGWRAGWSTLMVSNVPLQTDHGKGANGTNGEHIARSLGQDVTLILSDKAKYEAMFETLTETAARHYLLATHVKSAENLMGDLAVLKHSQGDVASAAAYFEHALPAFESDGWHELHTKAQWLYVDCLVKLERYQSATENLLELVARNDERSSQSDGGSILERLSTISAHLDQPLVVSMDKYFTELKLEKRISHFDNRDGFKYKLQFQHVMDTVRVDSICSRLVHVDSPSIEISLETPDKVELVKGLIEINLESTAMAFGMFNVIQLDIKLGNVIFRHIFQPELATNGLSLTRRSVDHEKQHEERPYLMLYPAVRSFDARISLNQEIAVHRARLITFRFDSGWNDIESINVRLKPASAGLRLHMDDVRTNGIEHRKSIVSRPGTITFGVLPASSTATVDVRYTIEQSILELHMRAEIQYTTAHGSFTLLQDVHLATQLPLDVEVKDVFHLDALLSTFTVRTTTGQPVLLRNITLKESAAYTVSKPDIVTTPEIVLAKLSVDFLYKITRKEVAQSRTNKQNALEIAVDCIPYSTLIVQTIVNTLREALAGSEYADLRRLILPIMTLRSPVAYNDTDLELAALSNESKVPSFAEIGWSEIINTLPTTTQRPLSDWLMKWHNENQRVRLATNAQDDTTRKLITIAMDVPTVDHIFLASLFDTANANQLDSAKIMTVGEHATVKMKIQYTRRWKSNESQGLTKSSRRPGFVYDILVDPETWLLCGRVRASFTATEVDGEIHAEFLMLPLRAGTWLLPTVVVRPVAEDGTDIASISCEASCTTAGQVVHVIQNQRNVRAVVLEQKKAVEPAIGLGVLHVEGLGDSN